MVVQQEVYYKSAMKAIHKQRLPGSIQNFIGDSIITKSGMDAITKAACLLQSLPNENQENTMNNNQEELQLAENTKYSACQIPVCMRPFNFARHKTYFEIEDLFTNQEKFNYPVTVTGIASELFPAGRRPSSNIKLDPKHEEKEGPLPPEEDFEFYEDGKLIREVQNIWSGKDDTKDDSDTNTNIKSDYQCLDDIVSKVLADIQNQGKAALIIDATFQMPLANGEINRMDPTYYLLDKLSQEISDGKLIVFFTKSFQKFATLGTQKTRAGDLTIICNANKNPEFRQIIAEANKELDDVFEYGNHPFQFVVHYLNSKNSK